MEKTICELFAGVGGFRLGFERLGTDWKTVWFSQWEPGARTQWAHQCYVAHFGDAEDLNGEYHTCEDIAEVVKTTIPVHTLLVGGFPCQDYSVAHSLASAQGIEGKKGVLWWQIRDTLIAKKPPFCLLENVDRLLKSPAKQRGRDFGVILACLQNLGYAVEWRVVNAAEYGGIQRRRRTYIFGYNYDTTFAKMQSASTPEEIIGKSGFFAQGFPVEAIGKVSATTITTDIAEVSDSFQFGFENAGYMKDGVIHTAAVTPAPMQPRTLGEVLEAAEDESVFIITDKMAKWAYMKGGKKIPRVAANGHEYVFSEGPIAFPDPWDRPARTMLTSEASLNRSTHVVCDPKRGTLRLLTPLETERIQGFDDGWTATGMPNRMRYFCMGNALVVPMITRMGKVMDSIINQEP